MSNLGNNGRLGNQLFQFAFLFGLSKAKGYDFCIPPNTDLLNCFDIDCKIAEFKPKVVGRLNKNHNITLERAFEYDQNFPNFSDNADYSGYYQTEKYFKHCKSELIQSLKFKEKSKIPVNIDSKDLVSIHVRRGDYVGNKYHPVVGMNYINEAKKIFPNKKFMVFSDDIEWCKHNNVGDCYAENKNHYVDLYQMTLCSGSIIANSSFSWWGAYLGGGKVVAPKDWFRSIVVPRDIYCEGWEIL